MILIYHQNNTVLIVIEKKKKVKSLTKENDRFEELYASEVMYNRNNNRLHEMLDIYRVLKQQITQFSTKIDFLETELKDYKDILKENQDLKAQIILLKSNVQGAQIKNQKETIELLLKENNILNEKLEYYINKEGQKEGRIYYDSLQKLKKENSELKQDLKTTSVQLNDAEEDLSSVCDECNLQKENDSLKARVQTLEESKISVSKAPSRWIDEIVEDLEKEDK